MPQAIGGAVVKVLISVAINIAVAKISKSMQHRPTRVLQKVDVEYSGAIEPRRRLYGNFRAAGLNVIPALVSGISGIHGLSGAWLSELGSCRQL